MTLQTQSDLNSPALPPSRDYREFENALVALLPHLRLYSRSLCGGRPIAEDVAQEALMKAWRARDRFEPGTNLKAWLFTILRNEFFSHTRRAWRETHWDSEKGERIAAPVHEQEWTAALSDTVRAMGELPEAQRDALILVGAGGLSHEDTAAICGAPVGTVKSRVARARASVSKMLDGDKPLSQWRSPRRMTYASDDILAQLSALTAVSKAKAARAI